MKKLRKPQPGDRPFRVIYLDGGQKKHKDFADFDEALEFYAKCGPALATMWSEKEQLR